MRGAGVVRFVGSGDMYMACAGTNLSALVTHLNKNLILNKLKNEKCVVCEQIFKIPSNDIGFFFFSLAVPKIK